MRLSWPFHRAPTGPGAPAAAAADRVAQRAEAPVRHDWREIAELRPSFVGDPGIRVQGFPDRIAGSQLPPPILEPLGHARAMDGPSGLVLGLARPTLAPVPAGPGTRATLSFRGRRASIPVQRSSSSETAPGPDPISTPDPEHDPPAASPIDDDLPAPMPRRAAAIHAPAEPSMPRASSLTVARTPELVLAPVRAGVSAESVAQRAAVGPDAGSVSVATSPTTGAGPTRTILRTSSGPRVRLGPPIERATLAPPATTLELAHPAHAAHPAAAAKRGASVQRHTETPAAPGPAGGAAAALPDGPLAGTLSKRLQGDTPGSTQGALPVTPVIPGGLVLARAIGGSPIPIPEPAWAAPVAGSDALAAAGPLTVAPLVGSTPAGAGASLRPTIPAPGSHATADPSAGSRPHPTPPRSRSMQRSSAQPSATPRTVSSPVTGPTRATDVSPTPSAPRRVARRVATGSPVVAGPMPTTAPSHAGVTSELVLARHTPTVADANDHGGAGLSGSTRLDAGGPARSALTVLRDAVDATDAQPEAPGQEPSSSVAPSPSSGAAVTSLGSPAAGAASTIPERELDEMVRRLYPRLHRSLSSELLVARERAGTLADLR